MKKFFKKILEKYFLEKEENIRIVALNKGLLLSSLLSKKILLSSNQEDKKIMLEDLKDLHSNIEYLKIPMYIYCNDQYITDISKKIIALARKYEI